MTTPRSIDEIQDAREERLLRKRCGLCTARAGEEHDDGCVEADLSALLEIARELRGGVIEAIKELGPAGVPDYRRRFEVLERLRALPARTPVDDALAPREGEGK